MSSGRNKRLRKFIVNHLKDGDVKLTREIVDAFNNSYQYGTNSYSCSQVLASMKEVERVGESRVGYSSYSMATWRKR